MINIFKKKTHHVFLHLSLCPAHFPKGPAPRSRGILSPGTTKFQVETNSQGKGFQKDDFETCMSVEILLMYTYVVENVVSVYHCYTSYSLMYDSATESKALG